MNHTTRKYPRTIQQAFGATESSYISEPVRPYDWQDRIVMWGCVLTVAALGVIWCLT